MNVIRAAAALAFLAAAVGCHSTSKRQSGEKQGEPIGSATLDRDGVLTVMLRAESCETGNRMVGDAAFFYTRKDKQFYEICHHVGGLTPGQSKAMPPWPDSQKSAVTSSLHDH
jgi:hypothetical protein